MKSCRVCKVAGAHKTMSWAQAHPDQTVLVARRSRYKRRHMLTLDDLHFMWLSQGGRCAICGETTRSEKEMVVDHDHACCPKSTSCNKCRRGLVHDTCNRFIGLAKDDPTLLRSAAAYLERF